METTAQTKRFATTEFVLKKHLEPLLALTKNLNICVTIRPAGATALYRLRQGAWPKPHSILDKSIKMSSLLKYYGDKTWQLFDKLDEVDLLGFVGYWQDGVGLTGLHLAKDLDIPNIFRLEDNNLIYRIDVNNLEKTLQPLKPVPNWQKNLYTGDYDLHDIVVFGGGSGRPRVTVSSSKEEKDILKKINKGLPSEKKLIQHGPQSSYPAHQIMHGEKIIPAVANPGPYPLFVADRGIGSIIYNIEDHIQYFENVGARVKEPWHLGSKQIYVSTGLLQQ